MRTNLWTPRELWHLAAKMMYHRVFNLENYNKADYRIHSL
jgi:hypothetical protein